MSDTGEDPRCPECGGPIGQTATYCMHCSADLTDERGVATADANEAWDQADALATGPREAAAASEGPPAESGEPVAEQGRTTADARADPPSDRREETGHLLAPDGLVDNTLTALVGIVGGVIVGVTGTGILGIATGSGWAVVFGVVAWLSATAYLVRRRTVQDAVAKSGYAIAFVLLLVPLVALSPAVSVDGGVRDRGGLFLVLLLFVAAPAGVAAAIGWIASRFVPKDGQR